MTNSYINSSDFWKKSENNLCTLFIKKKHGKAYTLKNVLQFNKVLHQFFGFGKKTMYIRSTLTSNVIMKNVHHTAE